ncbi:MAG: asparagine synthase-related protein [Nitrososphaerales archaeon]
MERVNGFACFIGSGNTYSYLAKALEAMKHRAWNGYLVDCGETFRAGSTREIIQRDVDTKVAVGYCLAGGRDEEAPFPVHGRIYQRGEEPILERMKRLKLEPAELAEALRGVDGDYSFAVLSENGGVVFGRDPLGVKPLFRGRREGLVGLASEAKALRAAGLEAESVSPGFVYSADLKGMDRFLIRGIGGSDYLDVDLDEAAEMVLQLVQGSLERLLKGRRVALGFSGGVDSSLLALLSSRLSGIRLVSVYAAGSRDEADAKASARLLGFDLIEVCLGSERVEKMVKGVSSLIERVSPMDVAIGLAVNAAASAARDEGCDGLILGQLADELFGGYLKYLRAYGDRGAEAAQGMMVNDTQTAYRANFERDEAAASPYSDLLLPYASCELAEYALSLHPKLKMNPEKNGRKIVLKEAALKAGVPEKIVYKPKKALQYSSNLQKLVAKIHSTLEKDYNHL